VSKFFQRKNNASCRFPHKLYNALLAVAHNPALWPLIGVRWVTDGVFVVDKFVFGRLLGITAYDGGLFHRQGNLPSHGFVEVSIEELGQLRGGEFDVRAIDCDRYRAFRHSSGTFKKVSPEAFFETCKWASM
jgi:hypothetical protein